MEGHVLRRKRRNSSLRLTSLKRKKTKEQIDNKTSGQCHGPSFQDNKQGFSDNHNQNKASLADSRTLLHHGTFLKADLLTGDRNSLSVLPPVKQSAPEETIHTLTGANDYSLAYLEFSKLNIEAAPKTSPPPPCSFSSPPTLQTFATPPPPPLNNDTTTPTVALPASSPPSLLLNCTTSSTSLSPSSTPTHKPKRPPIITSKMSRRVANLNLPTGKGGAPTAVPQFLSVETNLSTDSTDSQGSVRTQVPGSYHQQSQQRAMQEEQWYGQIDNGALPFATPDLNSSSTFMSAVPGASKGLNPNSQPFAPPVGGEGYASPSLGFVAGTQKPASSYGGSVNNGYSTQLKTAQSFYGNYVPPQKQMSDYGMAVQNGHGGYDRRGSMGGYQSQNGGFPAPNPYGHGNGAVQYPASSTYGSAQIGGPPSYNGASNHNPYAHFGQRVAMNGYGYQTNGQTNNSYPNNATYGVANTSHTYQNSQYGSANDNGYYPPGQAWVGQYQGHNQYAVQAPYIQPSNINRGKSTYYGSAKPNAAAPPYHPSNLTTAPVVNANYQSRHPENENHEIQDGGAVRPPSRAPSRINSTSPTKSKASTVDSSAEPSSSLRSGSIEEKVSGQGSPTPVARRPQEFSSEPRNSRTPTLRSRRGQTLVPSTDPSSKQAMVNWLENVFPTPPPKMSSLELSADSKLSGGDILAQAGVTLPSITPAGLGLRSDADPFTTAIQRVTPIKPALNPFAPLPQHLSPYTGGSLLQKPPVSAPLRRLAVNGKPAISDALEPANLPMVEYCRLAREDTWGVIRIKNIPYSVNRPEVLAFLGRNARIISEQDFEPVHIVMERVTSKTLDCYVEFVNFTEAVNAVNRFETNRTGGRGGRLGQRHVEVELSCQEQLMHDLFPKAKNVTWSGSRPIIKPKDDNDKYNSGFQGFIIKEELVMLVKHVEAPQRVSTDQDSVESAVADILM
ncbi:hypothetical protein ONS95_002548 [Cadophora gregata]|uniref:uncharacterized protein n=1 Tax=Cadophora gregata TaxID=51156 RepID=UPI0026DAE46B|nr:uncharacterized protein ONS95_002548 [Cadophora gregata]KAK0109877.1 hypothetical protein ONS95_002548 [Cadophora gregata]